MYKIIIGPVKYGIGDDYDATGYWENRFSKYGFSLIGSGNEGFSEGDNIKRYLEATRAFTDLCSMGNVDFKSIKVLDIGCGTGFYTQLLQELGVKSYTGVDITDVLFSELRKKFPRFIFIKKDITEDKIEGVFDLIIMIDVVEHIVTGNKLTKAMDNVKNCLSDEGMFIVSPIVDVSKRHLFYVRLWSLEDIKQRFQGYEFVQLQNRRIFIIKKKFK